MMMKIVELTEKQQEQIAPLLDKARNDNEEGRPGMVIAQVFKGRMKVGFLPHEKAKLFRKQEY